MTELLLCGWFLYADEKLLQFGWFCISEAVCGSFLRSSFSPENCWLDDWMAEWKDGPSTVMMLRLYRTSTNPTVFFLGRELPPNSSTLQMLCCHCSHCSCCICRVWPHMALLSDLMIGRPDGCPPTSAEGNSQSRPLCGFLRLAELWEKNLNKQTLHHKTRGLVW